MRYIKATWSDTTVTEAVVTVPDDFDVNNDHESLVFDKVMRENFVTAPVPIENTFETFLEVAEVEAPAPEPIPTTIADGRLAFDLCFIDWMEDTFPPAWDCVVHFGPHRAMARESLPTLAMEVAFSWLLAQLREK